MLQIIRLLLILASSGPWAGAAEQSVEASVFVDQMLAGVRAGRKEGVNWKIVDAYGRSLIDQGDLLFADPNKPVREFAYSLFIDVARRTGEPADRQDILERVLATAFEDRRQGREFWVEAKVVDHFRQADFTERCRSMVHSEFMRRLQGQTLDERMVLLVGVADVPYALPVLKELSQSAGDLSEMFVPYEMVPSRLGAYKRRIPPTRAQQLAFHALMACARMGDRAAVQKCIAIVDACEDDGFYKADPLMKRLLYVRQPEVAEYIKSTLLYNDSAFDDRHDAPRTTFAEIGVDYLRRMLGDFPTEKEMLDAALENRQAVAAEQRGSWDYYAFKMGFYRGWMEERKTYEIIR